MPSNLETTSTPQFRRSWRVSAAILVLAAPAVATAGVRILQDPQDDKAVIGRVALSAPPHLVWAGLERVDEWRQLFPDIRKLEVVRHEGAHWRVRLDSAIFQCGPHDYEVQLTTDRAATLKILAPGVDATGRIAVLPSGAGTLVEYRLRVKAGRIASWFVSEATLRRKQARLVEDYLTALERRFGTP